MSSSEDLNDIASYSRQPTETMASLVVDSPKVQLLDQMLVDLDKSFGAEPADLREVVTEATSVLHRLRNDLIKGQFSAQVAQLVKDGKQDEAAVALARFSPQLQKGSVVEILRLIYVDTKDLKSATGFVERLELGLQRDAYKALYEDVRHKGHTEKPEILLLQRSLKRMLDGDDSEEMLKQVDEDCSKIIDRIVTGVKAKDYTLSETVVASLGNYFLDSNMSSIVEKAHAAGTLDETLLLIKFSTELTQISNQCALIQALFEVLKCKNLLHTEQAMHLWAHAKAVRECADLANVGQSDQEKYISTCNDLDKNKEVYFQIYQKYVRNSDGQKIKALHNDNCHVASFASEFVNFFYDGDLGKARYLLSAARKIPLCRASGRILSSLYKKMSELEQLHTFEEFRIFSTAKLTMDCCNYPLDSKEKLPFEELQAKAPPCLRQLLWPKVEGAKFRLVNKFLKTPLLSTNMKVYCRPPSNGKDSQFWSAQVDPLNSLTTFTIHEKMRQQNAKLSGNKTAVRLTENGTSWKVTAVDEHHIKLHYQDKCLSADLTSSLADDSNLRTVSMKKEANSSSLQMWRVEAIN